MDRLTHDNLKIDRSNYSVSLIPPVSSLAVSGTSRSDAGSLAPLRYRLGSPIHITWTAPFSHSQKDWIGLYRVIDVDDRIVTKVSSRGKWMPVCRTEYDDGRRNGIIFVGEDESRARGEVVFKVDVLVWKCGVYEARYHHDGFVLSMLFPDQAGSIMSWPSLENLRYTWRSLRSQRMGISKPISCLSCEIVSLQIVSHDTSMNRLSWGRIVKKKR